MHDLPEFAGECRGQEGGDGEMERGEEGKRVGQVSRDRSLCESCLTASKKLWRMLEGHEQCANSD